MHHFVECERGSQVVPKGLFNDYARALRGTGKLELVENHAKQDRWNGEVVNGMFCIPEFFAHIGKRLRIVVIPVHVAKLVEEYRKGYRIEPSMFRDAVFCPLAQLVEIPASLGYANDRPGQLSMLGQLLQRGKNLFVSEIAGSAKKHYGVGIGEFH